MSGITDFKRWMRESTTLKLTIIGFLSLILLIPASMISGIIREREETSNEVKKEIAAKWGREQTITGPILCIPYKLTTVTEKGDYTESIAHAYFLPDILNIKGKLNPEIRYRGIYKMIVYNANLDIKGNFPKPDFTDIKADSNKILWDEALLFVGIPDMRGINKTIQINWNEEIKDANPGIKTTDIVNSGVSIPVKLNSDGLNNYSFNLDLKGSENLFFIPVGKETNITLSSNWETPSFDGEFLPDERVVDKNGFTAKWKVLHLNRNYPQHWINDSYEVENSGFGIKLLFPIDHYQKTNRSVKYAIMFISLTFLIFFFTEKINKTRIHPVQYFLVGIALCVFYTLLLSFSEQIGFTSSYILSSLMTVGLISAYAATIFKNTRLTLLMGILLSLLYGFLFTILQLEDYSLMMGSIGLFVVLSLIMYMSRKVSWYSGLEE